MLPCPRCKHENPADCSFCQACGAAVPVPSPSKKPSFLSTSNLSGKLTAPGCFAALFGCMLSSVVGMILGQVSSFLYAMVGQVGGLECLSLPLIGLVFLGSAMLSFGANRLIRRLAPKLP